MIADGGDTASSRRAVVNQEHTMTTESDPQQTERDGEYRAVALDEHGMECMECGWRPRTPVEQSKLHVHHITPVAEGGLGVIENLEVLCRDCHLQRHSESRFSHERVARLANRLADTLTHKKGGFSDRVARRVRLDSVIRINGSPPDGALPEREDEEFAIERFHLVEGVIDGDFYDEYVTAPENHYLGMCSCYLHRFGTHRARNICTHVGASIVRSALQVYNDKGEEAAFEYVSRHGERLDEQAAEYIQTQSLVREQLDTLDIESEFSESWADRARRQATKMTEYDGEYDCFDSECAGCTIRLTKDGYQCSDAKGRGWEDKFPCPGKLAAYLLDNSGDSGRFEPRFDAGQAFEVTRGNVFRSVPKGAVLVVKSIDTDVREVQLAWPSGAGERLTKGIEALSFEAIADLIIKGGLDATSIDLPAFEAGTLVRVGDDDTLPNISKGSILQVIGTDSERGYVSFGWPRHGGVTPEVATETVISRITMAAEEGTLTEADIELPEYELGNVYMVFDGSLIGGVPSKSFVEVSSLSRDTLYVARITGDSIGPAPAEPVSREKMTKALLGRGAKEIDPTDDSAFDVVVTECVRYGESREVGFSSRYKVKEDIKDLPYPKRSWYPDRKEWMVPFDALREALKHLWDSENDWFIYVRPEVRQALIESES